MLPVVSPNTWYKLESRGPLCSQFDDNDGLLQVLSGWISTTVRVCRHNFIHLQMAWKYFHSIVLQVQEMYVRRLLGHFLGFMMSGDALLGPGSSNGSSSRMGIYKRLEILMFRPIMTSSQSPCQIERFDRVLSLKSTTCSPGPNPCHLHEPWWCHKRVHALAACSHRRAKLRRLFWGTAPTKGSSSSRPSFSPSATNIEGSSSKTEHKHKQPLTTLEAHRPGTESSNLNVQNRLIAQANKKSVYSQRCNRNRRIANRNNEDRPVSESLS